MTTIEILKEWITRSTLALSPITNTPQLEAQVLAAFSLNQNRSWLLSHLDIPLDKFQVEKMDTLINKRLQMVPLPYILGHWDFYGLEFFLSPDVLIPRSETELLVSEAISWLEKHPTASRVADVGTGSGVIAVSIAVHQPAIRFVCADISFPALKIAMRNVSRHANPEHFSFVQSNLLSPFSGPFDLICGNLPYIPSATLATLPVRLYEPNIALDGGSDGLVLIKRLINQCRHLISSNGLILFEIEAGQSQSSLKMARDAFPGSQSMVLNDLAGLPRLLKIEV